MLGTSPAARGQKEVRLVFRPREAGEVSKASDSELETEGVARESA